MTATKNEAGNAVEIILETATNYWKEGGENILNNIVSFLNTACDICGAWDLNDFEKIEKYVGWLNLNLKIEKSNLRIIFDDLTYKLAELV